MYPPSKGFTTLMPTIDWPGFKPSLSSSSASARAFFKSPGSIATVMFALANT